MEKCVSQLRNQKPLRGTLKTNNPWSKKNQHFLLKIKPKANLKYTLSQKRFDKRWLQTAQQLKTTGPFGTVVGKTESGPTVLAVSCLVEATLHHVNSWPRAFHTCSSLPWVKAHKHVAVLYQGLQTLPSHYLSEMPVCYCYCIYAGNAGKLSNWSKEWSGQRQIPCSHLHEVSHAVSTGGSTSPGRAKQTQCSEAKFVAWKKLHWRWGLTGRHSVISLSDLRFLWDPVVTLRNLAHHTKNKQFVVSVVFWTKNSSWTVYSMYSVCFPPFYSPPLIIWNNVAKLTTLLSYQECYFCITFITFYYILLIIIHTLAFFLKLTFSIKYSCVI